MSSSSILILVIGILIATLLVIAGFVIPIFLTGGMHPRSRPRVFSDSPAGHLIMGFGYLYPPITFTRSRGSVHRRMERAFQRIDAVDPYAPGRRIGEALMEAGFVESTPEVPPATEAEPAWAPEDPEVPWRPGEIETQSAWSPTDAESIWQPGEPDADAAQHPAEPGAVWAQAEPDAEFPSDAMEPGSRFDRRTHEQSRDEE